MRRAGGAAVAAAVALLLTAGAARAEVTLVESDDGETTFGLGGYARELSGVQLPAIEGLGLPDAIGLSQALLRLEWKLVVGQVATFEVHDRLALTVTGSEAPLGLGVGVTPAPGRSSGTIRDCFPSRAVEGNAMIGTPRTARAAPRMKSTWPPMPLQSFGPSESAQTWPVRSTSIAELIAVISSWRAITNGSFVYEEG